MSALVARELVVITRRPAFAIACVGFVFAMVAFALTWPAGIPLYAGARLLPQAVVMQQILLATAAPWVICRCGTRERGDDLVHLSLFSAVVPSRILLARFVANAISLVLLLAPTVPVLLYAQQAAALDPLILAVGYAQALTVVLMAAAWTLVCEQTIEGPVTGWVAATMATVGVSCISIAAIDGIAVPAICLLLSGTGLAAVIVRADTSSRYLAEGGS